MASPAVERIIRETPYKEIIQGEMLHDPDYREQFLYDNEGYLVLRRFGLRVADIMEQFGEPQDVGIQITDTTMVTERAQGLKRIFHEGVDAVGYPHEVRVHFATKANLEAAVVTTAGQVVDLEGTAELDVYNFRFLRENGLIPEDRIFIFNGYKDEQNHQYDMGYARRIVEFHNEGASVIPVLEPNELPIFADAHIQGVMPVGLRLKFGPVKNHAELGRHTSQFGFSWEDLQKEAEHIARVPHLSLKMMHAMISAAETIPPSKFVESALFAAEMYAQLKSTKDAEGNQMYPDLSELNIGGGIPSYDSNYPFQSFIRPYLRGVMHIAQKYNIEPPTIVVESGTFIASDCQHLVFSIFHHAKNDDSGITHIAFNGSIFSIPDVFVLHSTFPVLAVNHANDRTIPVRITDRTCDSNDVMPPKDQPHKSLIMPETLDGLQILIKSTGAYESALGGEGDEQESKMVSHCANPEPRNVVIWINKKGELEFSASERPHMGELSRVLGFNPRLVKHFPKR